MLIVSIIAFGMWKKIPVYDSFVEGAEAGMKTVLHLIPTMIGLMLATGVLRASGFLDLIAHLLEQVAGDQPISGLSVSDGGSAAVFFKCRDRIAAGCLSEIRTWIHASE